MAALGLTFGQLGIGTNVYSLYEFTDPCPAGYRIIDPVTDCTEFPVTELGNLPLTIEGVIQADASAVCALIADIRDGSAERKISWMLGAAEVYAYTYSGNVTANVCINNYGDYARTHRVAFSFPASRTIVYLASDDSVLFGN